MKTNVELVIEWKDKNNELLITFDIAMNLARQEECKRIKNILQENYNKCAIHPGATYVRDAILRTLKEIS